MLVVTGPHQYEAVLDAVHAAVPPQPDPFIDLLPATGVTLSPRHYSYGTSSGQGCDRRHEIRVDGEGELEACGLKRPTRFHCMTRLTVSIYSPGFDVGARLGTPVLGRLTRRRLALMNAVRARLYAEADIAADRRAERQRERMRDCTPLAI